MVFNKINAGGQIADVEVQFMGVMVRNGLHELELLVEDANGSGGVMVPADGDLIVGGVGEDGGGHFRGLVCGDDGLVEYAYGILSGLEVVDVEPSQFPASFLGIRYDMPIFGDAGAVEQNGGIVLGMDDVAVVAGAVGILEDAEHLSFSKIMSEYFPVMGGGECQSRDVGIVFRTDEMAFHMDHGRVADADHFGLEVLHGEIDGCGGHHGLVEFSVKEVVVIVDYGGNGLEIDVDMHTFFQSVPSDQLGL